MYLYVCMFVSVCISFRVCDKYCIYLIFQTNTHLHAPGLLLCGSRALFFPLLYRTNSQKSYEVQKKKENEKERKEREGEEGETNKQLKSKDDGRRRTKDKRQKTGR